MDPRSQFESFVEGDAFANVFGVLPVDDQRRLRLVSKKLLEAFDYAVWLEHFVPCARSTPVLLAPRSGTPPPSGEAVDDQEAHWIPFDIEQWLKRRRRGSTSAASTAWLSDDYETVIGSYLLSGTSNPKLQDLKFGAMERVVRIGDGFLSASPLLQTVELCGLINVTEIGESFLRGCSALRSIKLGGLNCVQTVGSWFLCGCSSVQEVELSGLAHITVIPNGFLSACSSLRSIDLSELKNVHRIGHYFLRNCAAVEELQLGSGFSSATKIGNGFLVGCVSIKTIDLGSLRSVTAIGDEFMAGCSTLHTIELSALSNVTTIGSSFLTDCTSLQFVLQLSALSKVTSLASFFLRGCPALDLERIDVSTLPLVIGQSILRVGSSGITTASTALDSDSNPGRKEEELPEEGREGSRGRSSKHGEKDKTPAGGPRRDPVEEID